MFPYSSNVLINIGLVFLVSVGSSHFLSSILIEVLIVIFLVAALFMHPLGTVSYRLVVHIIDVIGRWTRKRIQAGFIVYDMDDFKRKQTGKHHSSFFAKLMSEL